MPPRKDPKTGRYFDRPWTPPNAQGKRVRLFIRAPAGKLNTQAYCNELVKQAIVLWVSGVGSGSGITFKGFYGEDFILTYPASKRLSTSQVENYERYVGEVACAEFGDLPIVEVDGAVVAKLVAKLTVQTKMDAAIEREQKRVAALEAAGIEKAAKAERPAGLGPTTINNAIDVLDRVLLWAAETQRAPGMPLRAAVEQYFGARTFQVSSVKNYRYHLSRHIVPYLGDVSIGQINDAAKRKVRDKLATSGRLKAVFVPGALKLDGTLKKPWELARERRRGSKPVDPTELRYSASTLRILVKCIKTVLKLAKVRKHIKSVPEIMTPPPSPRPLAPPHTVSEAREMIAAAPSEERRLIHLVSYDTGLRKSELIALEWLQIDWDHHKINLDRQIYRGQFKNTKGKRNRLIDMTPDVEAALLHWRAEQTATGRLSGYVFCHADGTPYTEGELRTFEQQERNEAGLRKVRWHDKRHTAASNVIASGKDPKFVQDFLGHTDLKTTQPYLHTEHRPHRSILADVPAKRTSRR